MTTLNTSALPGFATERTHTPRNFHFDDGAHARHLPGGGIIDGSKSRDPLNTGNVDVLRPGLLLGKITSSGKFAPAILGVLGEAIDATETDIDITTATGTELVRRIGASGTFKLTGPPTAAGTIRTLTATYSAVDSDSVTITALGTADVWTLTAPAGQDAGMYQLEVTTGKGTASESVQTTASLAANANTATVDAALEALANVGVGGVAAVYSDPTLTLTFSSNLGPIHVRVISDTTNDGGVFEGGWATVHTTTGVDGRFVTGSLIQPTDGSETPLALLDCFVKVTDDNGANQDAQAPLICTQASVDTAYIINYPADASAKAWVKAKLNASGGWDFSDRV